MASFTIKLVDHTGSPNSVTASIQSELQGFFNRVFSGTSDSATVSWGAASTSDSIIVRLVEDVANSYIVKTMKRAPALASNIGGHTTLRGKEICSEIYKTVPGHTGKKAPSGKDYAKLAFHECLHNVLPGWDEKDFMGKGGLADSPVGADLNQRDIDLLLKGIGIKGNYTQLQ
jgi:hypothetical protein